MEWIDTHCHLNLPEHFPDPAAAVASAVEAGVTRMVVIGIDRASSELAVSLASRFDEVYATVGFHPTETAGFEPSWLGAIRNLAAGPKVVAIGEIGLDFYWDRSSPADQEVALMAQLDLAEDLGLPVVYHCREAYDALLSILERRPVLVRQDFHCFAGDSAQAPRASALGAWFGVDGPVTYKNADSLRSVVRGLPRERVMVETDAPFLTPHPFRGKPNAPAMIPLIGARLAEVWGSSVEEVAASTTRAACEFFRF
jgi:TatD DNase family protein